MTAVADGDIGRLASGSGGRREQAKAERRSRIVRAARDLIRETGDTDLSMRMIAGRAGVSLTPAQLAEIHTGWAYVEPMLERIRTHGRGREAELALTFNPAAFGTETN